MKIKLKQYLLYFIPILLIELLFRVFSLDNNHFTLWIHSILYVVFVSFVLWYINGWNSFFTKCITLLYFIFIAMYALFQSGIKDYYGYFFSSRFLNKSVPDVNSYAIDFVKFLELKHVSFIAIGVFGILIYLKYKSKDSYLHNFYLKGGGFIILSYALFIISLGAVEPEHLFESSTNLYKNPYYTEIAFSQLGLNAVIPTDLQYLLFPNRAAQEVIVIEPEKAAEPVPIDLLENRKYDDTVWLTARASETNENFKNIDNFFLSKHISLRNEKTGIYKDMNLIYILVEAFDMVAIDKDLTPTLYKMQKEGTHFNNFYSPQFNCATAESELISLTSLLPVSGTCTMSTYYKHASPQTLFNLFKNDGYETSSYHNWNDQFYPRKEIHPIFGSQKYLDVDDLFDRLISGWQSDLTMMEGVVKDLNTRPDRFMAYAITSSTHLPYDTNTNLGQKYLSLVNKKFPNAPVHIKTYLSKAIELDKAMEHLLSNLNAIDNTVIAMFSDHRPLQMPPKYLNTYSEIDRMPQFEMDKTPFIIYTPIQIPEINNKVSSTLDMAPTLANLFDLKHDPRLYMGQDIYGDANNIVIFHNGSWQDQIGFYNVNSSVFKPYDEDKTYTQDELTRINLSVKQKSAVSSMIYTQKYFEARPFILNQYNN